jgi:glycosyltransferase involved in cell wall biosynthesis
MNSHYDIKLLSIIVPVGARRSNLKTLYAQYKAGVEQIGLPYEFIFVLDGSYRDAIDQLEQLLSEGEDFTVVNLTRSFGEAAALMAGYEYSSGEAIVTLPAYAQIDATDIGKLVAALEEADMAVGRRWPRHGNFIDHARRNAFHWLVRLVTGSRFNDLGCGARAMRRRVFEEIDLYGDQHRFVAILALRLGFRVCEVPVRQSKDDRFDRIYRPKQYAHHILDLFSIFFLVRFTKKPLRFFGMMGAGVFSVGALMLAYISVQRLFLDEPLADRPALLLAALLVVLGMQFFALGLLGELVIFTHARDLKDYRVEEVIHYPDANAEAVADRSVDSSEPRKQDRPAEMPPPAVLA